MQITKIEMFDGDFIIEKEINYENIVNARNNDNILSIRIGKETIKKTNIKKISVTEGSLFDLLLLQPIDRVAAKRKYLEEIQSSNRTPFSIVRGIVAEYNQQRFPDEKKLIKYLTTDINFIS